MNKPAPAPELELSPAASLGMVAVGLIIFWFCLHKDIDRAGYIPHWKTVDIYMDGNWLENESRVCQGVQSVTTPREIVSLRCPTETTSTSPHTFSVMFWGRIARPAVKPIDEATETHFQWNCAMRDSRYYCSAIN
jgi:hypothetical protein